MTKQRKLIRACLSRGARHMTASEIHAYVRETMPHIALGTVYRNLGLLVEAGEVARVAVTGRADVYETKTEKHDHMVCVRCGRIRDIFIPGLIDAIDYQTGEKALSYELSISYLCAECKKK